MEKKIEDEDIKFVAGKIKDYFEDILAKETDNFRKYYELFDVMHACYIPVWLDFFIELNEDDSLKELFDSYKTYGRFIDNKNPNLPYSFSDIFLSADKDNRSMSTSGNPLELAKEFYDGDLDKYYEDLAEEVLN